MNIMMNARLNKMVNLPALLVLGGALLGISTFIRAEQPKLPEHDRLIEKDAHTENAGQDRERTANPDPDIEKLYKIVRQSRKDLEALRKLAGIPDGRGERGHEGRGEHGERRREGRGEHREEGREGRGEHGARGREGRGERGEGGEEGGQQIQKFEKWDYTRNGARLIIAYDAATQSFRGTVENTTKKILSEVRVEVHLSNGVELGPTKRIDLKPGAIISVELSAADQKFAWWTTHPESGTEEGHGPGHEGEKNEEHGAKDDNRPKNPALRPLYNQIQLLRREIRMLARGLRVRMR